jgi:glycosyltransferase involved in cell wall biosynthesis
LDYNLEKIPISAVIATADRVDVLKVALNSLYSQSVVPEQVILIDASNDNSTFLLCVEFFPLIEYRKAKNKGAAVQRNEGLELVDNSYVLFMDDDIIFEKNCLFKMWVSICSSIEIGGVSAFITNQKYAAPGKVSKFMYLIMHGKKLDSYAGLCIGPAWNLLPEDNCNLPELRPVEWLNTTCVIYRKAALPEPVFSSNFKGYSLLEDLCLSLTVAKKWKLFNNREAKIFHDSQIGIHKENLFKLSEMEIINRYYVMSKVLERVGLINNVKFFIFQLFGIVSSPHRWNLKVWFGKIRGIYMLLRNDK